MLPRRPVRRNLRSILCWNRGARACEHASSAAGGRSTRSRRPARRGRSTGRRRSSSASPAPSAAWAADRHSLYGQLERRSGSHGFDLIRPFLQILAGDGPTVFPQKRADIEHAGPAPIQVGFPVHGKFLHAFAEIEETEMTGADRTATGSD